MYGEDAESVASVSSKGVVTTKESPGSVTVLVKIIERGFEQAVAVVVEVAPVAQLSLHPSTLKWPPAQTSVAPYKLPLGLTEVIVVHLHDRMGRLFDTSEGVSLEVE